MKTNNKSLFVLGLTKCKNYEDVLSKFRIFLSYLLFYFCIIIEIVCNIMFNGVHIANDIIAPVNLLLDVKVTLIIMIGNMM